MKQNLIFDPVMFVTILPLYLSVIAWIIVLESLRNIFFGQLLPWLILKL